MVTLPIDGFPKLGPFALPTSFATSVKFVQEKIKLFLNDLTDVKIVTPIQVNESLIELHDSLTSARDFIFNEAERVPVFLNSSIVAPEDDDFEGFNIYDNFFSVSRAEDLPFALFIHQFIDISRSTIGDLSSSVISLEELTQLVTGFQEMAEYLLSLIDPGDTIAYRELPATLVKITVYDSVADAAIAKWKIQHHAFNILMLFSAKTLTEAIKSLKENEFAKASDLIIASSTMFRASTAAMWSASSFTAKVYKDIVRPAMESTEAPGGFSGNQNREFESWRKVKNEFREWLKANIAEIDPLSYALRLWLDSYVHDMMQHVMVAAAMKIDGSLVDKEIEKKIGLKTERRAVDALQQLLEMRKKEFEFLFT